MKTEHPVDLSCSFCGKAQQEVRKLIAGPTVYVCDECIKRCNEILAEQAERMRSERAETTSPPKKQEGVPGSGQTLCCSFCGKHQREVKSLIAGPTVYICDECIGLCNDIISEELEREECAFVLTRRLSEETRALLAGILERGMPAAVRIRSVLHHRLIEDMLRRPAAGAAPEELLWPPPALAADWWDLHDIVTRATEQPGESGEDRPLEATLPEWVRPIAERLTGTLEVLDALARSLEKPGLEELRQLRGSIDVAGEKLREAREMLLGGPQSPGDAG